MSTNFTPTASELALVKQMFTQVDPQNLGILTGRAAVRVFRGAKLPKSVLGDIWSIADEEDNGWLSRKGTAMALHLIAHAQKGKTVTPALLNERPLPIIKGYGIVSRQNADVSIFMPPSPDFPPLAPQDKIKFQNLFKCSSPMNGLLSGRKARNIFLQVGSTLSNDQLMRIWDLADTQGRGCLNNTDFIVAMYFIQWCTSQQISFVPSSLPPGLYEQAGGHAPNAPPSITSHFFDNGGFLSSTNSTLSSRIPTHYTGRNRFFAPDNTGLSSQAGEPVLQMRSVPGAQPLIPVSTMQGNEHGAHWAVTPTEIAEADSLFDELDSERVGYIAGDVVASLMSKSQLPREDLAEIWDLADLNYDGHFTRDGFAIVIHLIRKTLPGQPIPAVLLPSLKPPFVRAHGPHGSPFQVQPEIVLDPLDSNDPPPAYSVFAQTTRTTEIQKSV